MSRSTDSRRARRTRRQCTAGALVLLASVAWVQEVSAVDPQSSGSAASGKIGGGPVRALAIDPETPTTLYAGAECSGVFKSVDGGDTWSAVNTGLTSTTVVALAIDPSTPTTVYAGTAGTYGGPRVFRSVNGGSSWSALTSLPQVYGGYSVNALAIDPAAPATLHLGTNQGVFRSLDGGSSWRACTANCAPTNALAIDPTTPTTLYAGTVVALFRSLDGGGSWSDANTGLPRSPYISALAINPTTPTTLYAGTRPNLGGGGVYRSRNEGSIWSAVNTGLTNLEVQALAIDPATPTTLYAGTFDGGVFRSRTEGSGWSAINTGLTNLEVQALAIDPVTPATLYAGTRVAGVFRSLNGGDSWQATGLGEVSCGDGIVACGPPGSFPGYEECDDGNTDSGDGCDAQCRQPRVVGTGTPQSCTEAAFASALAERSVRFNCGPHPVTVTLTSEQAITAGTTIDGGGRITLSGGGKVRIFTVGAGATLDARNLTIADGHGDGWGGGIVNNGTLTLTNCTLRGNFADWQGGAIANSGTLTLTNCTLSGNSALGCALAACGGGAISNRGTATLTNCTLSGNSGIGNCQVGGGCGGGIVSEYGSTLTLRNTIIANSPTGGDCLGGVGVGVTDGGHNFLEDATNSCGLANGVNGNLVGVNPLLGPLANNGGPTQTHALCAGPGAPQAECVAASPAIDAGNPEVCANPPVNGVDQRSFGRPGTGHTQCSIGAYEADAFSPEPCVGDCDGGGSVTIDELITLVNVALGNAQASECPHGVPNGAEINVALIIQAVNAALNGCGVSLAEQGCLTSGGTVTSAVCCASAGDFPDTCAIGACGCAPDASHAVRVCECTAGSCFDGSGCVRQ